MKALLYGVISLCFGIVVVGASDQASDEPQIDFGAVVRQLAPSFVRVEYTLQYDKGEPPSGGGVKDSNGHEYDFESLTDQERPLETSGMVLSPTQVVTPDLIVHPRFIKQIVVAFGKEKVGAKVVGLANRQPAVYLELEHPLAGIQSLTFASDRAEPYWSVSYWNNNGAWTTWVSPANKVLIQSEVQQSCFRVSVYSIIVDATGTPVGMTFNGRLGADDSWKGSPLNWPQMPTDAVDRKLQDLQRTVETGVVRVSLNFRSPKKDEGARSWWDDGAEDASTERNVVGVLLDDKTVLVLKNLSPKETARLEKIGVHPMEGDPVSAKFIATLKDYGCFVASTDRTISGCAVPSDANVLETLDRLMWSADVQVFGEKKTTYLQHNRVSEIHVCWKQQNHFEIAGDDSNSFLFDNDGRLLALPLLRRERVSMGEHSDTNETHLVPIAYLTEFVKDLSRNGDPANVPQPEENENRLAWMGVELQSLNRELARMNGVSDQTRDGQTGAVVSYVYPNSPAQQAGIEVGDLVLRFYVSDIPKPIEVVFEQHDDFMQPFPWEQLDDIPEQYLDELPPPWPSAENSFNRALTDLGFGTKYQIEYVHGGQPVRKDFEVVLSPVHYDAAPKFKSEALGLTIRNLTYEVRRYLQMKEDDPGVIVSKMEPGGKSFIAGVRPYEIITHVNGEPIAKVTDFERQIKDQSELRLSVRRMARERQVKINLGREALPAPSSPAAKE